MNVEYSFLQYTKFGDFGPVVCEADEIKVCKMWVDSSKKKKKKYFRGKQLR